MLMLLIRGLADLSTTLHQRSAFGTVLGQVKSRWAVLQHVRLLQQCAKFPRAHVLTGRTAEAITMQLPLPVGVAAHRR